MDFEIQMKRGEVWVRRATQTVLHLWALKFDWRWACRQGGLRQDATGTTPLGFEIQLKSGMQTAG